MKLNTNAKFGMAILIIMAMVFWFLTLVFLILGRYDLVVINGPDVSNVFTMNQPVSATDFYYGIIGAFEISLAVVFGTTILYERNNPPRLDP
jgi:hypothetical protein